MFFNYQLKNKNSDDKPMKLNYENKLKKKKKKLTMDCLGSTLGRSNCTRRRPVINFSIVLHLSFENLTFHYCNDNCKLDSQFFISNII